MFWEWNFLWQKKVPFMCEINPNWQGHKAQRHGKFLRFFVLQTNLFMSAFCRLVDVKRLSVLVKWIMIDCFYYLFLLKYHVVKETITFYGIPYDDTFNQALYVMNMLNERRMLVWDYVGFVLIFLWSMSLKEVDFRYH